MSDYSRRKVYTSDIIGWAKRNGSDDYYTFYKGGRVTLHFKAYNRRGNLETFVREVEYPNDCGKIDRRWR